MINNKLIDVFLQCAEQKDLIKGNGFDGFAGESGVTATKFQMYIGD